MPVSCSRSGIGEDADYDSVAGASGAAPRIADLGREAAEYRVVAGGGKGKHGA
jgi:hypothetical protein